MASDAVISVSQHRFQEEVLDASVPVLVDFWAEWCGPCKMLSPTLDEIAREWGASVKITKVNVDEEAGLAEQYGIFNLPALYFFKDGLLTHKMFGVTAKSQIVQKLESMA